MQLRAPARSGKFSALRSAPVMSLEHDDSKSMRQEPLEKFQDFILPLSEPVISRRWVESNAIAEMRCVPCASWNLRTQTPA